METFWKRGVGLEQLRIGQLCRAERRACKLQTGTDSRPLCVSDRTLRKLLRRERIEVGVWNAHVNDVRADVRNDQRTGCS